MLAEQRKATEMDSKAAMLGTATAVLKELAVEQIKANAGKLEWNNKIHCAALCRLIAAVFGVEGEWGKDERIRRLYSLFVEKGLGGNSSQFQQWLRDHGDDGAKVLPEGSKGKAIADDLLS